MERRWASTEDSVLPVGSASSFYPTTARHPAVSQTRPQHTAHMVSDPKGRPATLVSAHFPAVLAALASEKRRAILLELAGGPRDRRELAAAIGLSKSSIAHHLKRLCDHDLVCAERKGQQLTYKLGRHASASIDSEQAILNISASDGCSVTLSIPIRYRRS